MNTLQDKIRGSLIGGAIGDALGYPIEFMSLQNIHRKYGKHGYVSYIERNDKGKAVVSDDTQMTLFTANGLLFGITRFCTHGVLGAGLKDFVAYAYQDWLQTQNGVYDYTQYHYCWIRDIKELNVRRAPGNTCLSALESLCYKKEVINNSKGCGGVMRVAPVGLMAAADEESTIVDYYGNETQRREWDSTQVARLGGDCAEITHKHPLGYLPAAFQADLIFHILMSEVPITFSVFESFLGSVYSDIYREYRTDCERNALDELWQLIEKAICLASEWKSDTDCIRQLGEGWTGDEALAIAVYCTMKHLDSFRDAIVAAVNHDGDSDSTGAICGNLMGAIVGYDAIPSEYLKDLELKKLILELANDLVHGCTISEYHEPETEDEKRWKTKYVDNEPFVSTSWINSFTSIYNIMPEAIRVKEIKSLIHKMKSTENEEEKCLLGYQLAIKVFDTDTFNPWEVLPYRRFCVEPQECFLLKEYLPAYYHFIDEKYSPRHSERIFKLRVDCFKGKNPIIGVRNDGYWPVRNTPRAGLNYYEDQQTDKYRMWQFFRITPETTDEEGFAVFTNNLEKEFSVEIAHLTEDGTIHRIYHLFY